MERAIQHRFKIDFDRFHDVIKKYDYIMLKAEKMAFWPSDSSDWTGLSSVETRDVGFYYMKPCLAECEFLQMAEWLNLNGNWQG